MSYKYLALSVIADKTDVSIPFRLLSTAAAAVTGKTATNLTLSYWRQGGTRTAITASDLAAVNSAHSDGGVKEVDNTNMPGLYRLDLPDAAVSSGADWVCISVVCSGAMDYEVFLPIASSGTVEVYARLGAPAGASLAADIADVPTATENASALLDASNGVETGFTLRQALRLILAMAAGKLSGAATTTITIRSVNDTADRITATVDSNGNRTAVTTNVS